MSAIYHSDAPVRHVVERKPIGRFDYVNCNVLDCNTVAPIQLNSPSSSFCERDAILLSAVPKCPAESDDILGSEVVNVASYGVVASIVEWLN